MGFILIQLFKSNKFVFEWTGALAQSVEVYLTRISNGIAYPSAYGCVRYNIRVNFDLGSRRARLTHGSIIVVIANQTDEPKLSALEQFPTRSLSSSMCILFACLQQLFTYCFRIYYIYQVYLLRMEIIG